MKSFIQWAIGLGGLCCIGLNGCGGAADVGETGVTSTGLTGTVQKGPFLLGSNVEVSLLDAHGDPTGSVFGTVTKDDLGHFDLTFPNGQAEGHPVEVVGNGFYYNEIAGGLSLAPITLHGIAKVGQLEVSTTNLNVVTHMSYRRVLHLVANGTKVGAAAKQSESELRAGLGIIHPDPQNAGKGLNMSILGGDSADNEYLFGLSCILAQAAMLETGTCNGCPIGPSNAVDATVQELIDVVASDLESDGAVGTSVLERLTSAERSLDPAVCASNLAAWISKHGSSQAVPDLTRVIDTDKDGIANASDPDDDNDGTPDTSDCAPLDPTLAVLLDDGSCVPDTTDDDGDGAPDALDCAPRNSSDYRTSECDHWYWRFDRSMDWHEARDFCQTLGGYLASPTSDGEHVYVWSQLGASSPQFCWLGASDEASPGAWVWETGEPMAFADWSPGEPDNCGGAEHRLMMPAPQYMVWDDLADGVGVDGTHGGCGCGDCAGQFYPMLTLCEWNNRPADDDGDGVPNSVDCAPSDPGCACAYPGEELCNGSCVDVRSDSRNCGACGTECLGGSSCLSGTCTCANPAQKLCGGSCIDTQSDVTNCGGCGVACPQGNKCLRGKCWDAGSTPPPVVHYTFDDDFMSTRVIKDQSGNGHDASLVTGTFS